MIKQPVIFIFIYIGSAGAFLFLARPAFASVASEISATIRKKLGCNQAGISTAMTAEGIGLYSKFRQRLRWQQCGTLPLAFQSQYSCTIGTHKPGNIRTDYILFQQQLHRAEHSIIKECTSLHHNMTS